MVEKQLRRRGIHDERVLGDGRDSARGVRAAGIADRGLRRRAGPIGFGQTISQPYMTALMAAELELDGTETVLEVGAGCGYAAAVLGALAVRVVSLELIPELAELARHNLRRTGRDGNIEVIAADGSLGYAPLAPYDAITVAAGAPDVPPALLEQLRDPGRLVIPVGQFEDQELRVVDLHAGPHRLPGVDAVPLRAAARRRRSRTARCFSPMASPVEVADGVEGNRRAAIGDLGAAFGVGDEGGDAGGEGLGRVADPDAVAVSRPRPAHPERGGDHGALHGHGFQNLYVGAGGDGGGHDDEVGFAVERADVGTNPSMRMRGSGGGFGRIGEGAPVGEMIGAADHGQLHLRKLVAQQRPDALGEKAIGGHVGKVAERADEEQALAGRFRLPAGKRSRSTPFSITTARAGPSISASLGDITTTRRAARRRGFRSGASETSPTRR
jgi:protein-L-isoaspartate(D-aspartate) O-methyltransferase